MFVRSSDRNRAQRAKIRKDWRREETREDWAEQREFVWWPTALVLSLCAEWKEAPAWVCCIFVCVCVCVNLRSSAGGSAPSRPYWWWMQSRQHQAKANDYKASSVTAAQAAPGEWPCTATQPHPATIHHNAFRRASQQEVHTFHQAWPIHSKKTPNYIHANLSQSNCSTHLSLLFLFNSGHCSFKLGAIGDLGHTLSTRQQDLWSTHKHTEPSPSSAPFHD